MRYELTLKSDVATSFRCTKAANSLDIDAEKKSVHHFEVDADLEAPYSIGLIVGASGSGKTTFAQHVFGIECFKSLLDPARPVIDQFEGQFSYDECAAMLSGVGLTAVPCWIRPAYTLSNGQRARAECALQMAAAGDRVTVIDEWTSVVDRTVAKVMSHCIAKHARKTGKKIVLLSCHYDVIDWLNPDWVIDCNKQTFTDRRLLCRDFKRTERLRFDIRQIDRSSWKFFSRYHYLSETMVSGLTRLYGLFHGAEQIGFLCFANYTPKKAGMATLMHFNRLVIHPDYAGFGIGIKFVNACSAMMAKKGYDVRGKFSSAPVFSAMSKNRAWRLTNVQRSTPKPGGNMDRKTGFRMNVKTYSFQFISSKYEPASESVVIHG
jgi:ABC-type dipeptide/oligopeptide/nickel transport system ATPase subunit